MNLYEAKVSQLDAKSRIRWRKFVVRADTADNAWKATKEFLHSEPFDRRDAKPFTIHQVASINEMVHEVALS